MEMKVIGLAMALTAVPLTAVAASSDQSKTPTNSTKPAKPITEWTCADYLELQENYQPYAIGWATAYSKAGKPEDTAFDVEGIETIRPTLLEFCNRNLQESFWDKVKSEFKKHM
ncbi:acid-activated periplasmic chaperone HdeA [Endozoicomonas sp. SESOKO1]|uniref:acid-activated periplasmic chaperone HdeA n=1 Tax=Endozoicomonas sp. SESOKO1 TaxID=2828742 RepID=UPI00214918D2|nr:acid-activated periplasmic chaperone HdeA [Endozoicomonas sp. SESOKO1]